MFDFSELIAKHARERPDKIALADVEGGVTYREFDQRARRVANGLRGLGVKEGDRVIFVGRNRMDYFELLVAAAKTGAVMVSVNWRLAAADIAALIEDSTATTVVVDDEFVDLVPPGIPNRILSGAEFAAWREIQTDDDVACRSGSDTVIVQSYTSGTTGRAKGVLVTNQMFELSVRTGPIGFGIGEDSVIAAVMPVYHMGGVMMFAYAMAQGATAVTMGAFDPDGLLDLVEEYGITFMALAPVMLSMIIAAQDERPRAISSIDSVVVSGQAPTAKQLEEFARLPEGSVRFGYGSTELWGIVTAMPLEDKTGVRATSAGAPFEWVELAVFDPVSGERLAPGQKGELRGRTQQSTPGYWQRPEESEALYTESGWMRTGDIAYLDEDGYLYLTDRLKDMIISGGENVYPVEVERVLMEHPDVEGVAVVGRPHEKWGEVVCAFVVLKPSSTLSPEVLIEWSRDKLAGYQRPREVLILPQLPMNATGKVLRTELRDRLLGRTAVS